MKLQNIEEEYRKRFSSETLPYIKCRNCLHIFYYPRNVCPRCLSENLEVSQSLGIGTVYSITKIFRKDMEPVNYAIIEMDEGFRLYSIIVGCNDPSIGMKVKLKMQEANGSKFPFFEPLTQNQP